MIPVTPTSLGTFLTCPRQFEAKYITKEVVFQETAATIYGTAMHTALENRLCHMTPLPAEFASLESYANRVYNAPGDLYVEHKLAINKSGKTCPWKDRHIGGIADVLIVNGANAVIIDWKSGKHKEDPLQLTILAKCVFANFPKVQNISASLVFFKSNSSYPFVTKRTEFTTAQLDKDIFEYDISQQQGHFLPKKNGLCREWCDVVRCEFNGRRER
jgi:PD-(D/E)XK nuclease superfamily